MKRKFMCLYYLLSIKGGNWCMCDCCNIEIVCLVFVLELCWWFGGEW